MIIIVYHQDSAQSPDEQSQNANDELIAGDIMPTEESERLLRSGSVGGQWDDHIIPYKINWNAVKKEYRWWVKVIILVTCVLSLSLYAFKPLNFYSEKTY